MKKKITRIVSAFSAAAVLASQCAAAAYADSFSFDEAVSLGEADYSAGAVMTEEPYEEAFTELPAGFGIKGGLVPFTELQLSEEETAELVENVYADMEYNRIISAEDIVTETLDAGYDYTSDLYYAQLPASLQSTYQKMITDFDKVLNSSADIKVNTVTYDSEKYDIFYMVEYSDFDQICAFFYAFLYSNPQYFFADNCLFGTSGGKDYMFFTTYNNFQSGSVRAAAKAKIDAVTNSWMKTINACPDELSKECKIAELICQNSKYHLDENGEIIAEKSNQTIYGCLVDKICVCAGFSKTFTYFCHKAGITCTGIVSNDHAWNYVKLGGKWYETCLTAMNQRYSAYYDSDFTYYAALNRGSNVLYKLNNNSSSFIPDACMKNNFKLPSCSYDVPMCFYSRVDVSTPGQATVAWRNVYGASQYALYTVYNGEYTYAGKVTAPSSPYTKYSSYTIKNITGGRTYGFLVRALFADPVNSKNVWSGFTNACIVKGKVEAAEAKPVITKLMPGNGQMGLNWSSVSGAKQYAVYTYLNGKWTLAGKTTGTGMYVRGLANGTKYGFAVKAYVNSKWTGISSSDIKYAAPEEKPVISKVMPGNGQVGLNWTSVSGAKQYAVYTYLNGKWTLAGKTTSIGMYVRGLANGTKYGFAVKAYVNGTWTSITSADVIYSVPNPTASIVIDEIDSADIVSVGTVDMIGGIAA